MADRSLPKQIKDKLPFDPDSMEERYTGNGVFNLAPEIYRSFIMDEVKAAGTKERKRDVFYLPHILPLIQRIKTTDQIVYHQLIDDAKSMGAWRLEMALDDIKKQSIEIPKPQSGTELLSKEFPPPVYFVENLLCQGLTILAGKSKRGKTYLCLDMCMAISFGRQAFRKLNTRKSDVLFISLEDGEILVQENLRKIQPNLTSLPDMHFIYEGFPRLGDGALEMLKRYLDDYQVIVIDILGRILPDASRMRKNVNEYQIITDFLGPIHDIVRDREASIIITDHLRKAPSDDEFDAVMGSMAKIGVADHVMLYTRQAEENEGVLSILGKRINHHKVVVTLTDGHLEYVGEGEHYEANTENRKILTILQEEGRPLHTREIVQAMGLSDKQYHRIRMRLTRLFNEGTIGRHKGSGKWTLGSHREDQYDNPVPF